MMPGVLTSKLASKSALMPFHVPGVGIGRGGGARCRSANASPLALAVCDWDGNLISQPFGGSLTACNPCESDKLSHFVWHLCISLLSSCPLFQRQFLQTNDDKMEQRMPMTFLLILSFILFIIIVLLCISKERAPSHRVFTDLFST